MTPEELGTEHFVWYSIKIINHFSICSFQEKYDYIMAGPEKSTLDPMDQTPLTRFIKVFDLKDEAIVFQGRCCSVRA